MPRVNRPPEASCATRACPAITAGWMPKMGTTAVSNRIDSVSDPINASVAVESPAIDYATKHRLLAKVLNNSTTRSNVFLVFIQIDFFEAKEVVDPNLPASDNKVIRVGSKLTTIPSQRGFFVIDRTNAMESIHQQTAYIPRRWRDRKGIDRFSYSFYNHGVNRRVSPPQDVSIPMDYRPMILHREIIQDGN